MQKTVLARRPTNDNDKLRHIVIELEKSIAFADKAIAQVQRSLRAREKCI